jgi:hypothetical protein
MPDNVDVDQSSRRTLLMALGVGAAGGRGAGGNGVSI